MIKRSRTHRTPLPVRFWAKVTKSETGCWLWTGATTNGGYGVIQSGGRGKVVRAHRLSWELHNGSFDPNLDVCHRCDNPPCVRPDHLFVGTARENAADMVAKGRAKGGPPRGSRHPRAKLTEELAVRIRSEYLPHVVGLRLLAKRYGVSQKTVMNVVHRKVWTHV